MKLIISGATGFVGREVLRQSLSRSEITSVVALARKPISAPENTDASKLKSIVIDDYEHYSEEVKKEFAGASACIWPVAITPSQSTAYEFAEVKRVCQTSTISALKAMHESGVSQPFRFLYVSGALAERDQTKTPKFRPEYSLMRGETETKLLALSTELAGIETCIVRPGYITAPGDIMKTIAGTVVQLTVGTPSISVVDLATVMLNEVVNGFDKELLLPGDLVAKIPKNK
ncbi:putative nucleoside-diphosphate-sugar epimerase [Hypoxylon sp. FL1857]|nr:putative nucleoside-diphosphate-sugar epimerase [Hypoxylon sp. FL1857]